MLSAWGKSWGKAFGAAFGELIEPPIEPPTAAVVDGGFPMRIPQRGEYVRRRRQRREDELFLLGLN